MDVDALGFSRMFSTIVAFALHSPGLQVTLCILPLRIRSHVDASNRSVFAVMLCVSPAC